MVTADEIRSRTFLVALRGFDREEVKAFLSQVADAMGDLQDRLAELEAAGQAQADAAAAEAEAAEAAEDSEPESAQAPESSGAPSPFAEIVAQTQRILDAAQESAEEIRRQARSEAEREVKQARAQAARVIAEGERRREEVERVVEALQGERGGLADELRDVGRTIERLLRDLAPEPGAATVRDALVAAAREDQGAQASGATGTGAAGTGETTGESPGAGQADGGGVPTAAAPAGDAAAAGPGTGGEDQAGTADADEGIAEPDGHAPDAHAPDAAGSEASSGRDGDAGLGGQRAPGEQGDSDLRDTGGGSPTTPQASDTVVDGAFLDAGAPDAGGGNGQPSTVTAAAAVGSTSAAQRATAAATAAATSVAGTGGTGEGADAARRRAQTLGTLHPRLVRKLKRGLQDLQNATLDSLRRNPERSDVEPFLPDETAVQTLAALAEEQLRLANAAGIAAGAEQEGGEVDLEPSGQLLASQLGSELGGVLVTRLADALRAGFDAKQGMSALTERVDAVFSRMKSGAAGDVAAVALVRAFEGGRKDAWTAVGVTHRRWIRATEPPCTDPRCIDNESAGPVPVGERFPSRHDAPPVRPGCHCSTAPATR